MNNNGSNLKKKSNDLAAEVEADKEAAIECSGKRKPDETSLDSERFVNR